MSQAPSKTTTIYRIWIVAYSGHRPPNWHQQPRNGRRLELADQACYSRRQARAFLQGFNSHMLRTSQKRWAVAVEVR
ncbi:MAG TPA: hypothetical protein VIK18_05900 [Pirellulales bacterium]